MQIRKVVNLQISDFSPVRSRNGTGHSYVTVIVDGNTPSGILISGIDRPNPGSVAAAFRSSEASSIVGWLDPVTNEPVVVAPRLLKSFPFVIPVALVLAWVLVLSFPHLAQLLLLPIAGALVIVYLLFDGGYPGVATHLKRYRDGQNTSVQNP